MNAVKQLRQNFAEPVVVYPDFSVPSASPILGKVGNGEKYSKKIALPTIGGAQF